MELLDFLKHDKTAPVWYFVAGTAAFNVLGLLLVGLASFIDQVLGQGKTLYGLITLSTLLLLVFGLLAGLVYIASLARELWLDYR